MVRCNIGCLLSSCALLCIIPSRFNTVVDSMSLAVVGTLEGGGVRVSIGAGCSVHVEDVNRKNWRVISNV